MKSIHTLIASSLLATVGFTAFAQAPAAVPGAAPAAREGRHHFDPARMQEHMAKRQAALKQKLALTPAQESAWTSFTTAVKPAPRGQRMDREAMAKLSTPDRIDHMRALRNTRIAEMDRRANATKAFYAVLTPDQKKVFDTETLRRGHRGGHGPHGRG